jgi:hypothetical protein
MMGLVFRASIASLISVPHRAGAGPRHVRPRMFGLLGRGSPRYDRIKR